MVNKRQYKSIDLMKFVAAILVIALHTEPLYEININLALILKQGFTRLAVPFFFISSGYFFGVTLENNPEVSNKEKLKKILLRLLYLYVGWSIVYFAYDMNELLSISQNIPLVILVYIRNFVFVGTHPHLWYMPALMLSLVLSYIAYERKLVKQFLLIALILFVVGLFGQSYYWALTGHDLPIMLYNTFLTYFKTMRNGVFFGFFFVILGVFIRQEKDLKKSSQYLWRFLLCQSLFFVEICLVSRGDRILVCDMYLMLIPTSYYLFKYLLSIDLKISSSTAKTLRNYSMGIYFIHELYLIVFRYLWEALNINSVNTINFLLVTICSFVSVYFLKKFKVPFFNELLS